MEKQIRQTYFEGERPLFGAEHLSIQDTIFGKENPRLRRAVIFRWKEHFPVEISALVQ